MSPRLYYVHDPMCSWCWAFRPVWENILAALPAGITVQRILGGLAPDDDQPMPAEMRARIRGIWEHIQRVAPGTRFNFDFWEECVPRRSTYPACRAVIAARRQGGRYEEMMILAIQRAYYLRALNPSDATTLIQLAMETGLEVERFSADLAHWMTQEEFLAEIEFGQKLGARGFPSLIFSMAGRQVPIAHDYLDAGTVLARIEKLMAAEF